MRGQRVLDVALRTGEVDVVGANVDELDLGALDRVLEALDALARVVSAGQTDEAHALAAIRQRLQRDLARLLAGVDIARADIGDTAALGRVAVGGEQRHLLADTVERVAHRLRIDRADHDARSARRRRGRPSGASGSPRTIAQEI